MHKTSARIPDFPEGLNLFQKWPLRDAQKVPSVISFDYTREGKNQWGYSMDDEAVNVLQWTKLELEPRTTLKELEVMESLLSGLDPVCKLRKGERGTDVPRHITKSEGRVVEEYLRKLAEEWQAYISGQGGAILANIPLDIVVTHPAVSVLLNSTCLEMTC
jgi:hypothetical protein